MMASKGARAAIPWRRPLFGSTMARIAAIAVLSAPWMGWNTVFAFFSRCLPSRVLGINPLHSPNRFAPSRIASAASRGLQALDGSHAAVDEQLLPIHEA